nr:hypothetical protein [Mycoplasmopsis bovis]
MVTLGTYLGELSKLNKDNFRVWGPDEHKSNRLYEMFKVTDRQWLDRIDEKYDESLSPVGRIIDSQLSEHQAEGMLEGYVLTRKTWCLCFIWIIFKSSWFNAYSTYEMSQKGFRYSLKKWLSFT